MNRLAPILAQREFGPGTYISCSEEDKDRNTFIFKVGLKIPIEISDSKDFYHTIKKLPDLEEIRFELNDTGVYNYSMRSYEEFVESLVRKDYKTNQILERELIRNTYESIARIPNVANTMTPLMEISNYFRFNDSLDRKELEKVRQNREQVKNYIKFMVRGNFLIKENGKFYPTEKLKDYLNSDPGLVSVKLIGDMLRTGYVDLMKLLHLSGLKPYLSIAFSYYQPSSEARTLLKMGIENISHYHRRIYRSGVNRMKLQNHISMLSEVNVLSIKDRIITGLEPLLEGQLKIIDSLDTCTS
ncbi:MAG: hypothetical protein JXA22_09020 [Candidatus Thermoplasmatota archaeon]|nr:hypothetical protein [Candidatus Thermoplasmatota archaeon]